MVLKSVYSFHLLQNLAICICAYTHGLKPKLTFTKSEKEVL